MKIGVLSDLHIDRNERKLAPGDSYDKLLAELLYAEEIDLLLMAGDISSDYHDSLAFLDKMKNHHVSKLFFVPGNHDFWSIRNHQTNTDEIYRIFCEREESLVGRPYQINEEYAIVANPGWYDYGFASSKYSLEDLEEKKLRFGGWNDRLYVHWNQSDREVAASMLQQIEADIQTVPEQKIILMTHVVTHPQFTVPLPHRIYDYYNAFLGSKSYLKLYDEYPISHSIMGHVHFRKSLKENGIRYYCACLGNGNHWWTDDPRIELAYTLESFTI
ncbi:metallophosphoesterase [Jeotgalibaca caeni]|uniref:metallophosphoesterase n=1 Tax=Jeotgalibaca caeni TaxID=3028623 RepID=UPI00237D6D8F|nr:metallophosphoesterase [Jeotgalibaca caeni]MDE1548432.1 metallophosphoesterase [Jeotgalibaca caeni]